ncbi:MAG: 8-amino-7-oxononanoate synthase [Aureliella sp.]
MEDGSSNAGDWQAYFRQSLDQLQADHLRRQRNWHSSANDPLEMLISGQSLVNFGSNDYLGLRHEPELILAARRAMSTLGVGSGSSPLVTGYNSQLAELEQRLAQWQGTEAALAFSSGLAMNIGVVAALIGPGDLVLSDQLNHASLIDGCRLSGAEKRIYPHADVSAVEAMLRAERSRYRRAIVLTESVFSMDGDVAPLAELAALCRRYQAGLVVDEAHATGAVGATGAGLGEELGASGQWLAKLGTFSKGLGTCGGFVAGSRGLIDFLVNRCRSYIYSTAIAPPTVAATLAAVALMPHLVERRERLTALSQRVRAALSEQGWQIPSGSSPIVPVIVGSSQQVLTLSLELRACGLFVPAIRPPTVPPGAARLRITLSSAHSDHHIERLLTTLNRLSPAPRSTTFLRPVSPAPRSRQPGVDPVSPSPRSNEPLNRPVSPSPRFGERGPGGEGQPQRKTSHDPKRE